MILTVGNTKGGVGKTTIAINCALAASNAGKRVLAIDGDEQESLKTFMDLRGQRDLTSCTTIQLSGRALHREVERLAPSYDLVVIDVGGQDTGSLRAALTVTTLLLVPVLPSSLDLWAIDALAGLVITAQQYNPALQGRTVLNMADVQGQDNAATQEALSDVLKDLPGMQALPTQLCRRKVYRNALAQGQSILEYRPTDHKALQEFGSLFTLLLSFFERRDSI